MSDTSNDAAPASTGDIFGDLIMALNRRRVGMKGEGPPKKPVEKKTTKGSEEIKLPEPGESVGEEEGSGSGDEFSSREELSDLDSDDSAWEALDDDFSDQDEPWDH
eukprot:CAMPEP_0174256980 /NCGR_PEP_ID=MMETSP0439-20130205/6168_1 /TAXON_ID=0 /ORGANISM="Stereomyxa ramosa, Strain Chinc5" /LENGTH=105 /DNA_ID=CAMNT_0015339855 /DNA_START=258 /DNA_END=575 /DNA_ORIENTATION=+